MSSKINISSFFSEPYFYPILDINSSRHSIEGVTEKRSCLKDNFNITGLINAYYPVLNSWQECGLFYYQLRAKDLSSEQYLSLAIELRREFPAMFIIVNDRAAEALSYPEVFSGLHLGQEDLANLDVQTKMELLAKRSHHKTKSANLILGLSTHNAKEIEDSFSAQSETGIAWDYIALGPCFSTYSKKGGAILSEGIDLQTLALALETFDKVIAKKNTQKLNVLKKLTQLVLIGGINSKNISQLIYNKQIQKILTKDKTSIIIAAIQAAQDKADFQKIIEIRNS